LLEAMTAIAIIAILAAMAATAMAYGTGRARMNNAAFELAAMMSSAQIRASSRGVPHFVVLIDEGTRVRALMLERADTAAPVNWATAVPANNFSATGARFLEAVNLVETRQRSAGTTDSNDSDFIILNSTAIETRPLPAPFQAIPLTPAGPSRLLRSCSFCVAGAGGDRGVIRFNANGTVQMLTGPTPAGGVLGLTASTAQQRNVIYRLVAVSAPAGAVRVF
jgi:type II secretory pathway pseudopilin PulG